MAKRRTRREKEEARHLFTISYHPEAGGSFNTPVKRQIKNGPEAKNAEDKGPERAEPSGNVYSIEFIRRDIVKSIAIVSLILALELVIYLAVHSKLL